MGQPGVPNRISNENWDYLTVMEVGKPSLRSLEGKTIGELARERKREPWDVFLDLGLDDDLDTMFDCRLFNTDEKKVSELLRHPCAAVALSDAGAHLSFLCDAGFGLHLFGHWVRERGDMTLPQAVRAVTSTVADAYRIKDRGRIAPGAWADLMLFDPATVARGPEAPRQRPAHRRVAPRHAGRGPARRVGQRRPGGGPAGRDRRLRPPGPGAARLRLLARKRLAPHTRLIAVPRRRASLLRPRLLYPTPAGP